MANSSPTTCRTEKVTKNETVDILNTTSKEYICVRTTQFGSQVCLSTFSGFSKVSSTKPFLKVQDKSNIKMFQVFSIVVLFNIVHAVAIKKSKYIAIPAIFALPTCPGPYNDYYPRCPDHQVYCCPVEHIINCVNGNGFGAQVCERFKLECGQVEHTSSGSIRCVLWLILLIVRGWWFVAEILGNAPQCLLMGIVDFEERICY